jgi:hypothetical protein
MEIKEPFLECPKCNYSSGISSISKPMAMFHYYCPSCGYEEQGLAHILPPEVGYEVKDVLVVVTWEKDLASVKELYALKKIDQRFEGKKPQEVKRMVSFRPKWTIGPMPPSIGYEISDKAKKYGLTVEVCNAE